jgi:hypothetical protein
MSMTRAYSVIVQAVDDSSLMFFQQLVLPAAGLQRITSVEYCCRRLLRSTVMWTTYKYHIQLRIFKTPFDLATDVANQLMLAGILFAANRH